MNVLYINEHKQRQVGIPDCPGAVYLAARGFEAELEYELRRRGLELLFRRERLMGTREGPRHAVWAQNIWQSPRFIPIVSIAGAAAALKAIQRNWALYSTLEHRRASLIQEALPVVRAKPHVFGAPLPAAPMGAWTLWSRDLLLASPECSSSFANGEIHFAENKHAPPNRAYLKLWEVFTRIGRMPGPGDLCLDLGSSPGGWTWVLAGLGARVFSVDKAPLAAHIASDPLVEFCRGSAFAVEPRFTGSASWLFCDVACYPERLYSYIRKWIDSDVCTHLVCTIKFAGKTDFNTIDSFSDLSGGLCIHLFANKHEITWISLVK
jgi:23S rRNA (cytidine2498-2'-O)-methyltransferase